MKYSLEQVMNYIDGNTKGLISLKYGDIEITVKTELTSAEKAEFVEKVVDSAYINGEYIPQFADTAFTVEFAEYLTDLPLPKKESEDGGEVIDVDECCKIMNRLNIVGEAIEQNEQLYKLHYMLKDEIDKKIKYKNGMITAFAASDTGSEGLIANVNRFIDLLCGAIESLDTAISDNSKSLQKVLKSKKVKESIERLLTEVNAGAELNG